jgi:hypothetical protein
VKGNEMGLVKTRRLAAMQKQQRTKAVMNPPVKKYAKDSKGFSRMVKQSSPGFPFEKGK